MFVPFVLKFRLGIFRQSSGKRGTYFSRRGQGKGRWIHLFKWFVYPPLPPWFCQGRRGLFLGQDGVGQGRLFFAGLGTHPWTDVQVTKSTDWLYPRCSARHDWINNLTIVCLIIILRFQLILPVHSQNVTKWTTLTLVSLIIIISRRITSIHDHPNNIHKSNQDCCRSAPQNVRNQPLHQPLCHRHQRHNTPTTKSAAANTILSDHRNITSRTTLFGRFLSQDQFSKSTE